MVVAFLQALIWGVGLERTYRRTTFSLPPFKRKNEGLDPQINLLPIAPKSLVLHGLFQWTQVWLSPYLTVFSAESAVEHTACTPVPAPPDPSTGTYSPGPQRESRRRHRQRREASSPAGSAVGTPGRSEEMSEEALAHSQPPAGAPSSTLRLLASPSHHMSASAPQIASAPKGSSSLAYSELVPASEHSMTRCYGKEADRCTLLLNASYPIKSETGHETYWSLETNILFIFVFV